ncbi:hypothetical protein G3A43_07855 [Paraburkholderia aspalathi]|nr:hypothetical protein [Paraburkholderia aspalathi]MBK3780170.1 hypothetical protein [Paraburkholderia aspalathi]
MITVAMVDARLGQIAAIAHDYEAAHGKADCLFDEVLAAIAAGHVHAQALARAALKVNALGFARYTA